MKILILLFPVEFSLLLLKLSYFDGIYLVLILLADRYLLALTRTQFFNPPPLHARGQITTAVIVLHLLVLLSEDIVRIPEFRT